jgi:hypothetical protein
LNQSPYVGGRSPLIWTELLFRKYSIGCTNIEYRDDGSGRNIEKEKIVINETKDLFGPEIFALFEGAYRDDKEKHAIIDIRILDNIANNLRNNVICCCVGGNHAGNIVKFLVDISKQYKVVSVCGYKIPDNFPIYDKEKYDAHKAKIDSCQEQLFRLLNVKQNESFTNITETALAKVLSLR